MATFSKTIHDEVNTPKYELFQQGGYVTVGTSWDDTKIKVVNDNFRQMLFATICIALNIDDPGMRQKLKTHFDMIGPRWGYEQIYSHMVQKAYEIKYG